MTKLFRKVVNKIYQIRFEERLSTSRSDNQAYPTGCLKASMDYRYFNTLRKHPIYTKILEHVSKQQGEEYLDIIKKDSDIQGSFEDYKKNDLYGHPTLYDYPGIGEILPTTLRYIKVLQDLKEEFDNLNGMNICEIGVGYGGQCRIINVFYKPKGYYLVDI